MSVVSSDPLKCRLLGHVESYSMLTFCVIPTALQHQVCFGGEATLAINQLTFQEAVAGLILLALSNIALLLFLKHSALRSLNEGQSLVSPLTKR